MYYLKKTLRGIELIYYNERLPIGFQLEKTDRNRQYQLEHAQRAKREIIDLALSNNWDYMLTQTINPEKTDRYNYELNKQILLKKLEKFKERYDHNLKYIIIPELHKDKAIHFHGLLKFNVPDKHIEYIKNRNGAEIYKHKLLEKMGFNELVKIYNHQEFIAYYISKYITKSIGQKITQKRYYRSTDLDRPKKIVLDKRLDHWQDVMNLISVTPSYDGQFATKWRFTTAEMVYAFRHNKRIREFLKS
jgi:hypothetical protein